MKRTIWQRVTYRRTLAVLGLIAALTTAGAAQTPVDRLNTARKLFEDTNWEQALSELDRVVAALEPRALDDTVTRGALVTAYELRARTRFGLNDQPGTEDDILRLLRYKPDYEPPANSVKFSAVFETVRKASVGDILLAVNPESAETMVDGLPIVIRAGRLPLPAGTHRFTARQPGFRPFSEDVMVTAGSSIDVSIELERTSATVSVVSSPVGVDVVVNGVVRGTTQNQTGSAAPNAAEIARQLSVEPQTLSNPLVLADLTTGSYSFEFRRPCYQPFLKTTAIERLGDFRLEPVKLRPAVASVQVQVDAGARGAAVLVDDVPKGIAPVTLNDICEGARTVEVRSPYGRFVARLDLRTDDKKVIDATLKPAFAILSTFGADEAIRGGQDLRLVAEQKLTTAPQIAVFAPPADKAQEALRAINVPPSWLSYDRARQPLGEAARVAPNARLDFSKALSRRLEAQGVAALTVEPGTGSQSDVVLSLLAEGSSWPDIYPIRLDDSDSVRRVLEDLITPFELYRPSIGMILIDVQGVPGAMIAAVQQGGPAAASVVKAGDAIVAMNGKPIADASAFTRALSAIGKVEKVSIDVRDRSGATKSADVGVVLVPRAISSSNRTLRFNQLLVLLRQRLGASIDTADEPFLRLNIALALMRLGNFGDARSELERVRLSDGPGVSSGTVQYLLGNCYDSLGLFNQAKRAWTQAEASDSWLTEDGPSVKGLASERLRATAGNRP